MAGSRPRRRPETQETPAPDNKPLVLAIGVLAAVLLLCVMFQAFAWQRHNTLSQRVEQQLERPAPVATDSKALRAAVEQRLQEDATSRQEQLFGRLDHELTQLKVDTARLCQIGIHVDLKTESVNESDEHFGEKELKARYEFPFSYRVTDPEGTLIHSESGRLAWNANGTRMTTYENVTPKSGTVVVEHSFEKFSVPSPGEVTVTVNVQPDTTYEATANKIEVRVYDNVSSHAASVGGGAVMICFGPMLIGVGLLILIIALVTDASNKRDPRTI